VSDVRVLFVSSKPEDAASLKTILSHTNWKLRVVSKCVDALRLIAHEPFAVVICEHRLTDGSWTSLLHACDNVFASPRVIVCSSQPDTNLYGEVLNLGGYDLLTTPFDANEVLTEISLAWQSWNCELQKSLHDQPQVPSWKAASAASGGD
jgi:DNA-binding NtrC family response regulator